MKYSAKGKITHTVKLTGKDILDLMPNLGTRYTPGTRATIEFEVPGGGDYSSCSIDFMNEARVTIEWVEEEDHEHEDED